MPMWTTGANSVHHYPRDWWLRTRRFSYEHMWDPVRHSHSVKIRGNNLFFDLWFLDEAFTCWREMRGPVEVALETWHAPDYESAIAFLDEAGIVCRSLRNLPRGQRANQVSTHYDSNTGTLFLDVLVQPPLAADFISLELQVSDEQPAPAPIQVEEAARPRFQPGRVIEVD